MGTIQTKIYGKTNRNNNNNKTLTNNYKTLFLENNDVAKVDEVMHLGHCVLRERWEGNFSSPIKPLLTSGAKVLDVGCGSGTWICEMSSDYPTSRYIGIDLLPLFPTTKPFNVQFIQHDFLNGLPFPDATFDFIHIRYMIFDLTEAQWEQLMYSELVRVCKVGGWIEISDPELNLTNEGPVTERINYSFRKKIQSRGINPDIISLHARHFPLTPKISSPIHDQREFTISSRLSQDKLTQSFTTYMLEIYRCILNSMGHEIKFNNNVRRNSLMSNIKKNNNIESVRRKASLREHPTLSSSSSSTSSFCSVKDGKDDEIDKLMKTIEIEFDNYGTRAMFHRFYAMKTE